jgi:60 kDa SS-A/Ro ribonucleoprotein
VANKATFGSATKGRAIPATDTKNKAGGTAYGFGPQHALAQLAVTGTFNETFYGSGVDQLEGIRVAADQCSPEFVAKAAIYARQKGGMKDMPAALMAMLSKADTRLFDIAFERVIDNGKQIRNLVQMIRCGAFGRKSLSGAPKRLIRKWIKTRSSKALFRASVGNDPSIADVIRLVHPKPVDAEQKALIGYILGRDYDADALPEFLKQYEAFKRGETAELPDVEFRMLTSLPLTDAHWAEIALRGQWAQTRMNLNSYAKHGVFEIDGMTSAIAAKLADPAEVRGARAFPYQLLAAYLNTGPQPGGYYSHWGSVSSEPEIKVPQKVRNALQDAMEIATEHVPSFGVPTHVIVDVSGSMHSPITGARKGATSKVRCVDVAGLVASCVLRKNEDSLVIPVDTRVHSAGMLNSRDTVMTNAEKLAELGGGGTHLGEAMCHLNRKKVKGGLIIIVSDNMSWRETASGYRGHGSQTMTEFRKFQARNPGAKLVCIDLQPYTTTQAPDEPGSVMNIGGFSDSIWDVIAKFVQGEITDAEAWVSEIESIELLAQPIEG